MNTDWMDRERGAPVDETIAAVSKVKDLLRSNGKGSLKIGRDVGGVGIQHWSLKVDWRGGPLDLELEARGLSLHEAALGMQVILEGVL